MQHLTLSGRVGLWAVMAAAVACGASPAPPPTVNVRAGFPGATAYRSDSELAGEGGRLSQGVRRVVEVVAMRAKRPLDPDGRLDRFADALLSRMSRDDRSPPFRVVDFMTGHVGLVEPTPHLLYLGVAADDSYGARIEASLSSFLGRHEYTHYGVATRREPGGVLLLIVLSSRRLSLKPVPREVGVGETFRLRGRLAAGLAEPVVSITRPEGSVSREPLGQRRRFDAELAFDEPGPYRVELTAQGSRGVVVVGNFTVYVGVRAPASVTVTDTRGTVGEDAVDDVAEALFELVNQERARMRLEPLERDPRLAEIALGHSTDMRNHGFVGHRSPTTGEAHERVFAAGIRSDLVLENIGRGYSADEVHQGLMRSPAHRSNILSPRATHVGIGVVVDDIGDHPAYLVTQVFIQVTPQIDADEAPGIVLQRINAMRARHDAAPVELDDELSAPALRAARRFLRDPSLRSEEVGPQVTAQLDHVAGRYERVASLLVVGSSLDDAGDVPQLADPDIDAAGVGVAQGTRPDSSDNAVVMVIVIAWAR